MISLQVLIGLVLAVTGAYAGWGAGFNSPVDCSTTAWGEWSTTTVFQGQQTRTREILRRPAHGGKTCPSLIDTKFNKTLIMTTKQVADSVSTNFLNRNARVLSGTKSNGQVRDLLVILDSSGSIGTTDFKLAVTQIAKLLGFLCPDPKPFDNNVHKLAVIRYSSQAVKMFDFNAHTTTTATVNAIKNIKYTGGGTNTAEAFKLAKDMFVKAQYGARIGNPKVKPEVLILTDGHSNNLAQSISAASSLQQVADVYGLVIGGFSTGGQTEILQYVSKPIQHHLFSIPSFRELKVLLDHVEASLPTHRCAPFKP